MNLSPWPILRAIRTILLIFGRILIFEYNNLENLILGFIALLLTIIIWWRDITREATFEGFHTKKVITGIKIGIILFIISEIFFFIRFFWSFYHSRLNPRLILGITWPPTGIYPFNPFKVPLLNTIILLISGITITWCHNRLINNNFKQTKIRLLTTIILGIYFSILQYIEYIEASFIIRDRTYGSTFFITTGFHGIHVIIGSLFLLICLIRHLKSHFSTYHHFGFEAAAWYWHFVDIIWLLVYRSIYWWGR